MAIFPAVANVCELICKFAVNNPLTPPGLKGVLAGTGIFKAFNGKLATFTPQSDPVAAPDSNACCH